MEIISLVLSIIAVLGSLFTYFNHDRKIKKQELLINDYELKKRHSEEVEQKKAQVKGNIIPYAKGLRKLVTFNAGKSVAYNIRIEILNEQECIIHPVFGPYEMLNPQESFENNLHLAYGHTPTLKIKYIWDDEFGDNNQLVQVLDLK
jgi:hypothetical protein